MNEGHLRSAPAVARNRDPILDVLRGELPAQGLVLEVASGTGEHVVHFARAFPDLEWQPSDPFEDARRSIAAWSGAAGLANVRAPVALDAAAGIWPIAEADAILCINMVHISPWGATVGLLKGAGRLLPTGGLLYLYGPYRRGGRHTAPSNAAFDADLRARNAEWGVRDLEAVIAGAEANGLSLQGVVEMPANNLSVVLRREG
jgi:SAM-dependent methyltransferase